MHAVDELDRGRESYATRAWTDAFESLSRADHAEPLAGADLELLARAAYMLGRDDDYVAGLERAHRSYLDAREGLRAVRCAFWIGHNLLFRGDTVGATGWFARALVRLTSDGDREGCGKSVRSAHQPRGGRRPAVLPLMLRAEVSPAHRARP